MGVPVQEHKVDSIALQNLEGVGFPEPPTVNGIAETENYSEEDKFITA